MKIKIFTSKRRWNQCTVKPTTVTLENGEVCKRVNLPVAKLEYPRLKCNTCYDYKIRTRRP